MKAAALLLLAPAAAAAQPAPVRVQPARDVVVTYRVDGPAAALVPGGLPGAVRLSWDAAGQRVRAEADGRDQVVLLDVAAGAGQVIDGGLRIVVPLPVRAGDLQPLTLQGARLTPRGRDTVAGLPCTVYAVQTARAPGTACITADGVPLRGEGQVEGRHGRFTALSVAYGPLPPALFAPPPGYVLLDLPAAARGLPDLRSLGNTLLDRRP